MKSDSIKIVVFELLLKVKVIEVGFKYMVNRCILFNIDNF